MAAYIVFTRLQTLNRSEFGEYVANVGATTVGHPARILAVDGDQQVLEGSETEGTVIVEFPSMEAARAWYDSDAYQAVVGHRHKGAVYSAIIVKGIDAPRS